MDEQNTSHEEQHAAAEHAHAEATALPAGQKRRDLFLPVSILVAAVVIGGALVFATIYKGGSTPGAGNSGGAQAGNNPSGAATTTNQSVMALGSRDAILGSASATVTMIEYGDYQCPFCGQFFAQTEPDIVQNYVDSGKVRFIFRDFSFLGAESDAAANAAQCSEDQNKLWAYHDALYSAKVADDAGGGQEDDGFFSQAELLKLGNQVGLNMATFTSCVENDKDASIVAQEKASAGAYGVDSTPTFFINGQMITGAQPYSIFQQALDSALQG